MYILLCEQYTIIQYQLDLRNYYLWKIVAEPRCFHRDGQEGARNQPGVAQKSSLFQYKNVVDHKLLDYFSAWIQCIST